MTTNQRCTVLFGAVLLVFPLAAKAQVVNSSFEEGGAFSFDGWSVFFSSQDVEASDDPPPGAGVWALKLWMSQIGLAAVSGQEGGGRSVAYQTVPGVEHGDIWEATAWVRVPPEREGQPVRLYWTDFRLELSPDSLSYYPGPVGDMAEATSSAWTLITAVDTLLLAPGDSAAVVLDPGYHFSGQAPWHWAGYDLVTVERVGNVTADEGLPPLPTFALLPPRPSPFRASTEIRFTLPTPAEVALVVYDGLGREAARLVDGALGAGEHRVRVEGAALPAGAYLLRLTSGGRSTTRTLVRLD